MTYRKMLPCPRCGHQVRRYTYESGWTRVECDFCCNYMAMPAGNIAQAIANHNRKAAGDGEIAAEDRKP